MRLQIFNKKNVILLTLHSRETFWNGQLGQLKYIFQQNWHFLTNHKSYAIIKCIKRISIIIWFWFWGIIRIIVRFPFWVGVILTFLNFLAKTTKLFWKRVNKLRFSRNWRDWIRGHISANGSKDGRPLEPSLIASRCPLCSNHWQQLRSPDRWTCDYIIQRAILQAMVWELKDDSQPLCCLAPHHFQVLEIFVLKTIH